MQQRRAAPSSCRVRSVTPGGVCPSPGPPLSAGSTTVLSGLHQCKSLRRTVFSNSEFTKGRECSLAIITSNHRASLGTCPPWSAAAWHGSPGAWAQPGGSSHTRRLGLRGRSPPVPSLHASLDPAQGQPLLCSDCMPQARFSLI